MPRLRFQISLAAILLWTSVSLSQTSTAASSHANEINDEAGEVFNSLRKSINELPPDRLAGVMSLIQENVNKSPGAADALGNIAHNPSQLLTTDVTQLTYRQRSAANQAMIQSLDLQIQQVVPNSGTTATPSTQQGLSDAAKLLNQRSPTGGILTAANLAPLLQKDKSIGRLLWTKPALLASGTPMWQLAGTVFVTSPGIVATACHTLSGQGDQSLIDITGKSAALRSDIVLKVEFSDSSQFQTMYTVSGIAAISGQAGCDVAQLKIEGANDIPPLKVAAKNVTATRILVVGYPLLNNYSAFTCVSDLGGITEKDFCAFHTSYPDVTKVVSPGHVLSRDAHDGVSVFTYDAPTDGGQSGSPVFDADSLDVIGIHYCCTGAATNTSDLSCATWHPQNVSWNEAIASETIVDDTVLKPNISDIDH